MFVCNVVNKLWSLCAVISWDPSSQIDLVKIQDVLEVRHNLESRFMWAVFCFRTDPEGAEVTVRLQK
jgi:DNA-binding FadR family transcriptional regulator